MDKSYWVLTEYEMNLWSEKLASDWTIMIWKHWIFVAGTVFIWLVFLCFTLSMFSAKYRFFMYKATGSYPTTELFISSFFITWYLGLMAYGVLFDPTPYGYYLQKLLGEQRFAELSEWFFSYLTLFGPLAW